METSYYASISFVVDLRSSKKFLDEYFLQIRKRELNGRFGIGPGKYGFRCRSNSQTKGRSERTRGKGSCSFPNLGLITVILVRSQIKGARSIVTRAVW